MSGIISHSYCVDCDGFHPMNGCATYQSVKAGIADAKAGRITDVEVQVTAPTTGERERVLDFLADCINAESEAKEAAAIDAFVSYVDALRADLAPMTGEREPLVIQKARNLDPTRPVMWAYHDEYPYRMGDFVRAYDALRADRARVTAERDRLVAVLRASPDEMTREACLLIETLKDGMGDKRELLHRLNTDEVTVRAQLLESDQKVFALTEQLATAQREAAGLRDLETWMRDRPDKHLRDGWIMFRDSSQQFVARCYTHDDIEAPTLAELVAKLTPAPEAGR